MERSRDLRDILVDGLQWNDVAVYATFLSMSSAP
jgi:hypothetical protein